MLTSRILTSNFIVATTTVEKSIKRKNKDALLQFFVFVGFFVDYSFAQYFCYLSVTFKTPVSPLLFLVPLKQRYGRCLRERQEARNRTKTIQLKLLLFSSCRNSVLIPELTVQLLIKQRKNSMISSTKLTTLFSRFGHTILYHRFVKCKLNTSKAVTVGEFIICGTLLFSNGED